jgi:hypothetical protein
MLENTLPQLEQLIELIIVKNNELQRKVTELENQKSVLVDENETLQLEVLEGEGKQTQTSEILAGLLQKLQSVEELS